ncbi:hypothetical protein [Costertonia aggregata]|uniref:Uncharacterized protein n=1 Tax=Costertonia aggregata TaxID=343403 RepID=A0A7H9ARK4_9FLAO|nr:hypothetical protein [Costertonia aggregata]QLG46049.1 hypothetical protein HYG79_12070 [Costertonia aggregata]
MINTRSPYYITAPVSTGTTSVTLTLKINNLTENSGLSAPQYSLTKNKPSATTTFLDFEISNMIRDFYDYTPIFSPFTALLDSNDRNVLQLNYSLTYEGSGTDITVLSTDVFDGYGYYEEGINPQVPSNAILLSNDYYIINKNGFFNIPVYNDGTHSSISVDGTPYTLSESTDIKSKIKNMWLNCNDFDGTVQIEIGDNSITLEVQDECKYRPTDVLFLNKYGAWEIMTFFKARKESIQIEKSTFKNNFVSNGAYSTQKHSFQDYNKNAREQLKLSSGYVPESYNETIRQLLLSEYVFLVNSGNFIPVNVDNSSYQYQTRIIDKLINHSIDFNYSYDKINSL